MGETVQHPPPPPHLTHWRAPALLNCPTKICYMTLLCYIIILGLIQWFLMLL